MATHSIATKQAYTLPLMLLFALVAIFFTACEPDLKEVDRIANMKKEEAVDISRQVTVIYSDSTIVKAEMSAPEMRIKHDSTQVYEFPKGIKIIFYDKNVKETQRITSDYAIQHEANKTTTFKKNVIVTMADGSIIKTEEIVYDEGKESFYNQVPITAYFKDNRGNLQGSSFTSDKDFKKINIQNSTGVMIIKDNSMFPTFGQ
ncbi:LPS export ABC transporter periplasmic protein LptC [Sphingobacterium sp. SRCM116780]|uniref:LPS export ABC transporter periplasmic protein LptC n=1 Tax=Sphingobacterium sp. SRCM116780 TaxID=2907623 RepID=UPI001F2F61C7|nr:LPS export ABC transporter periplasmic protein LptC [Sphingobacterium sp. SRCM116780]UIR55312.1 LPS export ABC transporter periplasmic protein LptC [Sphingobacterium sp. SRCM116780]